jgi:hypothetical protein
MADVAGLGEPSLEVFLPPYRPVEATVAAVAEVAQASLQEMVGRQFTDRRTKEVTLVAA